MKKISIVQQVNNDFQVKINLIDKETIKRITAVLQQYITTCVSLFIAQ